MAFGIYLGPWSRLGSILGAKVEPCWHQNGSQNGCQLKKVGLPKNAQNTTQIVDFWFGWGPSYIQNQIQNGTKNGPPKSGSKICQKKKISTPKSIKKGRPPGGVWMGLNMLRHSLAQVWLGDSLEILGGRGRGGVQH